MQDQQNEVKRLMAVRGQKDKEIEQAQKDIAALSHVFGSGVAVQKSGKLPMS